MMIFMIRFLTHDESTVGRSSFLEFLSVYDQSTVLIQRLFVGQGSQDDRRKRLDRSMVITSHKLSR